MRLFVARVTRRTEADRVSVPRLGREDGYVPGTLRNAIEVEVAVSVRDETEARAWESKVGQMLAVVPLDDERADDWFDRCPSIYGANQPLERCGFPALTSAQWYMHDDVHESATWNWGSDEVRAAKEERRG